MIRPLVLLAALGLAVSNPPPLFNCTGLNGVAWNGCRSFGVCEGGRHQQIDCPMGTGFSRNRNTCVDIRQADWPCSIEMRDCSGYPRTVHRLPELESGDGGPPCSWYYTCIFGRFVAHQPCTEGMVYSEQRQNCRYPYEVEQPCGPLPRGTEGDGTAEGRNWPQNQDNPRTQNNSPPRNNNNNWGSSPNNNNNNNQNQNNFPSNNNNWGGSPNSNNNQNQNTFPRNNNNNNNWNNPNNPNTFPSNNNNWNNPSNPNTFPSNNNNNNWNNNQWNGGNTNTDDNPNEEDDWDGGDGGFGYAGR